MEYIDPEEAMIEEQKESLAQLKFFPAGTALIDLLQVLHDSILTQLVNVPGNLVFKVSELQGKYKIINLLLQRIMEEKSDE